MRSTDPQLNRSARNNPEVDLALAVLCALFPGVCFTHRQIAELTGMSHGGPYFIEQRALKKLRTRMRYTTEKKFGEEAAA